MNFGVCEFSHFAITDWRLRRWRLCFLAPMTATPKVKKNDIGYFFFICEDYSRYWSFQDHFRAD